MRRRIKLFTTLASLGLSLALMTFGVFAAASHTLTVSSTVSFSIGENISCDVNCKTFRQTNAPVYSDTNIITNFETSATVSTSLEKDTWNSLTSEEGKMTLSEQAIYWMFEVKNTAPISANNFVVGVGEVGSTAESFTTLTLPDEIAESYTLTIFCGLSEEETPNTKLTSGWTSPVTPQENIYVMVKVTPKVLSQSIAVNEFNFALVVKYSE